MVISDPTVTLETEQAEREIIACAVRAPGLWERLRHVRPDWFTHWSDQAIWRAIQASHEENGCFEVAVVKRWLQEYFPDDTDALLDRLASIATDYLHAEFIDFYLTNLERSGERLAIRRWAGYVSEMCESGYPFNEIIHAIASPPVQIGGAA